MECRDRSREIGVPDVEAFKKKCERTGVHRGVIVSASGFAKTALAKAESMDIGCMALEDAERFNWCQAPGVVYNERDLLPGPPWHVEPSRPFEGEQTLYDSNDKVVDVTAFSNIAQKCLTQRDPAVAAVQDERAVKEPVLCSFMNDGASSFYMIDRQGERVPLAQMFINVLYRIRQSVIPFSFHQYINLAKGGRLSEVAVATIEKGKATGKIVLVNEGDGVRVSFIPEKAAGSRSRKLRKK
jgi:hypothetical protein